MSDPKDLEFQTAARWICEESLNLLSPTPASIALFGSSVSGTLHESSDIDLLIVSDVLPSRPYDRSIWIDPVVRAWRGAQKIRFKHLPRVLSALLISKAGFNDSLGLRLSLSQHCMILHDDGFLEESLKEAKKWVLDGKWTRRDLKHGGWAWIPNKGVA